MRITIDDLKIFIGDGDPISTDWIVYAKKKGIENIEEEVFRSMDDTKNIYSISATLKYVDGSDVLPEEIEYLYCKVRINYDDPKHGDFQRFDCTQALKGQ